MSIEVKGVVRAYEEEGKECKAVDRPALIVRSHWNRREMVVLEWPNGVRMTFAANDLQAAITNAKNSGR